METARRAQAAPAESLGREWRRDPGPLMPSEVSFEVDLTDWGRTVRDIEAHHDDFSGRTFERYTRGLFRRVIDVIPPPTVGAGVGFC
ncbi:MAG TPA: hypothetical protein PL086_02020 [Candidatus Aminicenantes bacterium]|nr:hypothetical protein [Candidatus Aminicenantes bacterium]